MLNELINTVEYQLELCKQDIYALCSLCDNIIELNDVLLDDEFNLKLNESEKLELNDIKTKTMSILAKLKD